jgi:hypothetical protein
MHTRLASPWGLYSVCGSPELLCNWPVDPLQRGWAAHDAADLTNLACPGERGAEGDTASLEMGYLGLSRSRGSRGTIVTNTRIGNSTVCISDLMTSKKQLAAPLTGLRKGQPLPTMSLSSTDLIIIQTYIMHL